MHKMSESEMQQLQQTVQQLERRVDKIKPPTIPWYQRLIAFPMTCFFVTGEHFIYIIHHRLAWMYATSFGFFGLKLVSGPEIEKWIGLSLMVQFLRLQKVLFPSMNYVWGIVFLHCIRDLYATLWSGISIVCAAMMYLQVLRLLYETDNKPVLDIPNLYRVLPVPAIQSLSGIIAMYMSGEVASKWITGVVLCVIPPMFYTLPRTYYSWDIIALMILSSRIVGLGDFITKSPSSRTIRIAFICTTCLFLFLKVYG